MSTIRANAIIDGAGGNTATINGKTPLGTSDIASSAQAAAGTDNATVITPLRVRDAMNASGSAPVYACRAWINFNGVTTVTIRASGNVSSVVRNSAGNYTVNFATAMPDANYAVIGSARRASTNSDLYFGLPQGGALTSSAVQVAAKVGSDNATFADADVVSVAIFR